MRTILSPVALGLVLLGGSVARADVAAPKPICADGSSPVQGADINAWGCPNGVAAPPAAATPAPAAATPALAAPPPQGAVPAAALEGSKAGNHPDRGDGDDIRLGELSSLGSSKLLAHDTRLGVEAGLGKIGEIYYLTAAIDFDMSIKRFAMGLSTPINIPVFDPSKGLTFFPDGVSPRPQDYAQWQDWVRWIRYLTYGVKEGDLYVNLSTASAETMGHGAAVRRYTASIDINAPKLSGEIDAKFKYGGFEGFVGDVLNPGDMVGGLIYLKPFGGFDNILLQRFSLGLTYAADFNAPLSLSRSPGVPADSQVPNVTTGSSPELIASQTAQVHSFGVSVETKVLRTYNADIKPYINFNQMAVSGVPKDFANPLMSNGGQCAACGGGPQGFTKLGEGLHFGGLGRFGFGENGRHALRVVLEGRVFQNNYMPEYFDTFYPIQRYQFFGSNQNPQNAPTKLDYLMASDSAMDVGYYAELQYALAGWFSITGVYEDSTQAGGRNVIGDLEVPSTEYLRFFGTVYYRGLNLYTTNGVQAQPNFPASELGTNLIYFAGARVKALPILFFNVSAFQSWQMDQTHSNNSYRNVDGLMITAEVGYEFSRGSSLKQ